MLLGAAFVLRYIVLESLYAPTGGTLARVLTVLLEGVSLGAMQYEPAAPATGYLAFLALGLYLVGLFLLRAPQPGALVRGVADPSTRPPSCAGSCCARSPGRWRAANQHGLQGLPAAPQERASCRASCAIAAWPRRGSGRRRRSIPADAALGHNPPGFPDGQDVACRFVLRHAGGRTPKFYCALATGEVVKVKYGAGNGELHAEVVAARLLAALGFSADQMLVVRRVRCIGCPAAPFTTLRCLPQVGWTGVCAPGGFGSERIRTFAPAVIERRLPGRAIEASENQGWAWFELDRIDPAAGGAPPADVDALRLFAVLLGHWDNKSENQRLVCPPGQDLAGGACAAPVAVMQDVGATFGPLKLDLPNWRATPIWQDAAACRVSMKSLPFAGGTFPDRQISEGGRTALLRLLQRLSDAQLAELFTASGATSFDAVNGEGRHAEAWVAVFQDKVRQIRDAGPCPAAATASSAAR